MRDCPLTIWILQTGEPLPIDGANARPMRAINLCNALMAAGHAVVLWSSAFYHQEKRHRSSTFKCLRVAETLEVRLIPSMGYDRHVGLKRLIDHAQLALNLKSMLMREKHLPDAAFIGYPPIETAFVMTNWLAERGVPSMLDVKDQWPSLFLDSFPEFLRPAARLALWPYYRLARGAMRNAAGLSAMADSFLDWALSFAGREKTARDAVFPLTSPAGEIAGEELETARRWWDQHGIEDNGRPRICFVGSLMSVFDFKPVQEAAKIGADEKIPYEFVICGDGGSAREVREMMGGLPNVHFPGWVDRPRIEALAERCIGAIAPIKNIESFQKSLPNKVIDALSLGLPILCPLKGEVASLIEKNGVGIRYGTDTGKRLHECIEVLIQDKGLQRRMSQKARMLYDEKFSFDLVYGGLVAHLEKLAACRRGPAMP